MTLKWDQQTQKLQIHIFYVLNLIFNCPENIVNLELGFTKVDRDDGWIQFLLYNSRLFALFQSFHHGLPQAYCYLAFLSEFAQTLWEGLKLESVVFYSDGVFFELVRKVVEHDFHVLEVQVDNQH